MLNQRFLQYAKIDHKPCGLSAKDWGATENPVSDLELNLSQTATKAIEFFKIKLSSVGTPKSVINNAKCAFFTDQLVPTDQNSIAFVAVLLKFSSKLRHLCDSISAHSLHNFTYQYKTKYLHSSVCRKPTNWYVPNIFWMWPCQLSLCHNGCIVHICSPNPKLSCWYHYFGLEQSLDYPNTLHLLWFHKTNVTIMYIFIRFHNVILFTFIIEIEFYKIQQKKCWILWYIERWNGK